jgi:DNA repair protein RadC
MGWRTWLGRKPGGQPGPAPLAFDALIDLNPGDLPAGLSFDAAVAMVVGAVGALPGAGWISVEVHPRKAPVAARVFPAGTSTPQAGEAWAALLAQVQGVAEQTLADARAAPVAEAQAAPGSRAPDTFEEAFAQRRRLDDAPELGDGQDDAWASSPLRPVRGFGEAQAAPIQMDALAELMALAQTVKPPAPISKPALASPPVSAAPAAASPDTELMARLLAFVLPTDGRSTAEAAIQRFGSFAAVLAAPELELRQVPGLGTHSRAAVKLVHAAAVRLARAGVTGQPVLEDGEKLRAYLTTALARERVEQFRILFLDDRGMLKADEVQATGTVNHTPVYPREVVRRALELAASSLVLVHNHPSGDPTPSRDDLEMTRQIEEAATALSITVRDHLIIGNGRWLSFREAGLLG